jgi:hypothetical protein
MRNLNVTVEVNQIQKKLANLNRFGNHQRLKKNPTNLNRFKNSQKINYRRKSIHTDNINHTPATLDLNTTTQQLITSNHHLISTPTITKRPQAPSEQRR